MTDRWCTCGHRYDVHDDDGYCKEIVRRRCCRCTGFAEAAGTPEKAKRIDAEHIVGLLRERHAFDVFVTECKNGPTHHPVDRLLKFDAWAMSKSWAHWSTIGYEVKVSRHDFEQDQKWVDYLPYCHQFSFVCPGGLIRATDLPDYVGLIWVSQNGERLHMKRKPTWREPDHEKLLTLMTYVLMARTVVVADMHEANRDAPPERMTREKHLETQREFLRIAEERRSLALMVRGHVRKRINEASEKLIEATNLQRMVEAFTERLAKLGIVWNPKNGEWGDRYRVDTEIDALVGACDPWTLRTIENGAQEMLKAVEKIRELRKETAATAAEENDGVKTH